MICLVGSQAYILQLWDGRAHKDSFVYGMTLAVALGSSAGPLMVTPFLEPLPLSHQDIGCHDNTSCIPPNISSNGTADYQRIAYGFLIAGALGYIGPLLFLMTRPKWTDCQPSINPEHCCVTEKKKTDNGDKVYKIGILVLFFWFSIFEEWMEMIPGDYLSAFAVRYLGWSLEEGSYLVTVYWISYAGGLLVCVILALVFNAWQVLTAALLLYAAGFVAIATLSHYSPAVVWTSVVVVGACASTVVSSSLLVAEMYMDVDGKAAAVICTGASLGLSSSYGVVSLLITAYHTLMVMVYLMIAACVTNMVILCLIACFGKCYRYGDSDENRDDSNQIDSCSEAEVNQ